jgi:hypothetical protein
MSYSRGFLASVNRYFKASGMSIDISSLGLRQFWLYESKGFVPRNPDPSFTWLVAGKRRWEWTLNEMRRAYDGETDQGGWPGWLELEEAYADDPEGLRQTRQRIGMRVGHVETTS